MINTLSTEEFHIIEINIKSSTITQFEYNI